MFGVSFSSALDVHIRTVFKASAMDISAPPPKEAFSWPPRDLDLWKSEKPYNRGLVKKSLKKDRDVLHHFHRS